MRTIKIIYHDKLSCIHTISAHHIRCVTIRNQFQGSKTAFISLYHGSDYLDVELPTKKARSLYHDMVEWLNDGCDNLVVELLTGLDNDPIDYVATRN